MPFSGQVVVSSTLSRHAADCGPGQQVLTRRRPVPGKLAKIRPRINDRLFQGARIAILDLPQGTVGSGRD
jgi:hypothetical protein